MLLQGDPGQWGAAGKRGEEGSRGKPGDRGSTVGTKSETQSVCMVENPALCVCVRYCSHCIYAFLFKASCEVGV